MVSRQPCHRHWKRKQMAKMLLLTLIPIFGLSALSCFFLSESITSFLDIQSVAAIVHFSTELGMALHNLQKERDQSALYLSRLGAETKTFLLARYPVTDESLENLSKWPEQTIKNKRREFESKRAFLTYLNRHRNELDLLNQSVNKEIEFYTDLINVFLDWLYMSIKRSSYGSIWRTLVAYLKLVGGKEDFGIERALGGSYFARGGFAENAYYRWYNQKRHLFKLSFVTAKRYSSSIQTFDEMYGLKYGKNVTALIEHMRGLIQRNAQNVSSLTMATYWFDNMTLYMDYLLELQTIHAKRARGKLGAKQQEDGTNVAVSAFLIISVLALCPVVVKGVHSLTGDIQSFAVTLADKTSELNKEKRKTDSLLYQMLPKQVADQLKQKKEVNAEFFKEVTIFFSDIDGFSSICAQSSPMQIVSMLNALYSVFDERIELYDVYKVETIRDSYMVASGLPVRNGEKHASEIGNMSLDLLATCSDLEILDLPGTKICLRIGIHTGPCVAGVVGSKLPRYCLFGDTVNTASRMETHGLPNRIHMSSQTNRLLAKHGGYVVQSRGPTDIKGKGIMSTYWLLGRQVSPSQSQPNVHRRYFSSEETAIAPVDTSAYVSASAAGLEKQHVSYGGTTTLPSSTEEASSKKRPETSLLKQAPELRGPPEVTFEGEEIHLQESNDSAATEHPTMEELEQEFEQKSGSPPILQLIEGVHF